MENIKISKIPFSKDRDFFKRFFTLTFTIALQNIIVFGVNLADNIMLGAYSELSLSGVAAVNQIQFFLQMLVMGTGEGIVVLASRYWGDGDTESVKRVSSVGMRIGLGMTAVLFLAVLIFPRQCLGIFTDKSYIIDEAQKYLAVICFSYFFFCVSNILLATLRSVETAKIGFWVSLSTLCINVCLNSFLIYGISFAPELGIVGAAIATLISRIVELIIVVIYLAKIDKKLHIKLSDYFKTHSDFVKRFLKVSMPVILVNVSWGIAMGAQVAILGRMEASVISANSIANTVFQILTVAMYGAASATSVMIGKSVGEKKSRETIIGYAKTLQIIYISFGIITGICIFLFKDFVINFYNISDTTRELAIIFMTVLSVTSIGTSYQMPCLTGIVRGGGDTSFVLYNDLIFIWLIVLPSAFLCAFVFQTPPLYVFICLKSDQILKCFVAVVKVNRYRWIKSID